MLTIMTVPMINLFTEVILLHAKLCNMYRVYCLNCISKESEVELRNTNFVDKMLQHNQFSNEQMWIIKYYQIHSQLSKITMHGISFKTKLTSLVNTQGLTDSALLKGDHNNDRNSADHNWLKAFFGVMYVINDAHPAEFVCIHCSPSEDM